MSEKKHPARKRAAPKTSTKRQVEHLGRLEQEGGKRMVVDLSGEELEMRNALRDDGYATTYADVMRRALREAHATMVKAGKARS